MTLVCLTLFSVRVPWFVWWLCVKEAEPGMTRWHSSLWGGGICWLCSGCPVQKRKVTDRVCVQDVHHWLKVEICTVFYPWCPNSSQWFLLKSCNWCSSDLDTTVGSKNATVSWRRGPAWRKVSFSRIRKSISICCKSKAIYSWPCPTLAISSEIINLALVNMFNLA